MEKQDFDSKQRFSLRKLSIGLSSILVGMTFFGVQLSGGEQVHAATADTNTQSQNNGQAEQGNNKPGAETQTFVLPKREKSAVDALSSLAAQKNDATGDVITDNDDGSITIGEEPGLDPNTHDPVHETHDFDYQGASQSTTIHYKDADGTEHGTQTVTGKTGETTNVTSPKYPKGWISDNPATSVDYQGATTPGGSDSKATVTYKDGSQNSSNIQYGDDKNGSSNFDVTVRHRVDGSDPGKGGLTQSDGQPAKTTTNANRQIVIDDSNLTEAERDAIKLNDKSAADSGELNRTVTYERQAAIDAITGKVDITKNGKLDDGTDTVYTNGYSAWTVKSDSPNKDFDAVAITGPKGYEIHITKDGKDVGSIEAQDVIGMAGQTHVYRVTFVAKDGTKKIHFVMDNGHGQTTDAVAPDPSDPEHKTIPIPDATISGKSDQKVSPNSVIPEGWVPDTTNGRFDDITIPNDPAEQEKPIELKIKHGSHDFGPDSVPNPGDTMQGEGDHKQPGDGKPKQDVTYYDTHLDLTQTVTGISQTDPSAQDTQSIQFVRGFTVDDVTGAVTFKDWQAKDPAKDKFTSVTATAKDGYSAHLDDSKDAKSATDEVTFDQTKLNSLHDAIGSTGEHKEAGQFNHHFTYTANSATQTFKFAGEDGQPAKNADETPIEADVENGVTDGKAVAKIPAGWTVVSAKYDGGSDIEVQGNTVSVKFAPEGQGKDVTITIKHGVDHHTPDELPNPGDKTGGDHTKPGDGKSNHEITYYDTHLDLTQTVNGIDQANPDAKDTQEIHFTRGFSIDQVTGEVNYDAWQAVDPAKNKFTSVTAKAKDGYSAHLDGGDAAKSSTDEVTFDETKLNGLHDAIGSDGANLAKVNKDQFTHNFTYTANASHQNITFYDQDNHNAQVGDVEKLQGKTDEKVGVTIPTGYDVVSARDATGKDVTEEVKSGKITLSPEDSSSDITVTVSQHKDVIGPTDTTPSDPTGKDAHPNNPGGKKNDPTVPSDPTGPKLKADVDYDSLHRMVTQTVTKYGTDGTALPDKDVQTVYYERTATINRATGDVTYDNWAAVNNFTDNRSTPKTGFNRVTLPDVAGYKSSAIDAWTPTQEQLSGYKTVQDLPKDLRYNANAHDVVYKFIDDDDNGKQIGSDITIHGVTDETLNQSQLETFGLKMPDPSQHYVLAQGQSIPTSYTFAADPATPVEIHFKHETKTITPDDIPTGTDGMPKAHTKGQGDQGDHDVTKDDFSKEIGRTITVNVPTGTVTVEGDKQTVASQPQDHSQTTTLTRTGTYDMRTGVVTWSDWTHGSFDEFDVPAVPGYTPSQTKVDGVGDVGPDYVDPKVDITYTANEGSQPIHFVDKNGKALDPNKDKDDNGNPVTDGSATGVTDQTVTVTVPEGWKLVDPKDSDTKIPAPGEDGQIPAKDVKIEHDVTPVDHDHPKTPGDPVDPKKPEGPKNGDGMTHADLNQVAIREIHVTFPANYTPSADFLKYAKDNGDHTYTITQKIGYYRDALQDKVTGKLAGYRIKNSDGTFTDIMLDSDTYKTNHGWMFDATTSLSDTYNVKDGVAHFNQISIPSIQGYSAHIEKKPTAEIVDSMSGLKRTRSLYFVSFMALPRPTQKDQTVEDDKGVGSQSVTPADKKEAPAKEVPENPIISGKKVVKGVPAPTTPSEPKKPEKPQQPSDTSNTGAVPDVPKTPEQPTQPTEASQPTQPSAPVQTSQATDGNKKKPAQKKTKKPNKKGKVAKKNKNTGKNTNKRANGYGKGNRQNVVAHGVGNSQNATKQLANTNSGKTMKHAAVSQSTAKSDSGKLPQTGNKQSGFAMILGAIASTLGLFGLAKTKRKHD